VEKNVARAFKSVGIKTVLIFGVHIHTRARITYCVWRQVTTCFGGRILSDLRNMSREYNTPVLCPCTPLLSDKFPFLVTITMNVCCTTDGEAESTGLTYSPRADDEFGEGILGNQKLKKMYYLNVSESGIDSR
jgi:hypothetical protein